MSHTDKTKRHFASKIVMSSYQKITKLSKILQKYTPKLNIEYCAHGMLRTSDNDTDKAMIIIPKVLSLLIDHWHHILSSLI